MREKTIIEAIDGLVVRADKAFGLFAPGDRVLVGVSGGKDSAVLLHDLARKRRAGRLAFEFDAVHVRSDFARDSLSPALVERFAEWGAEPRVIDAAIEGRLKPGRRMNCWWCSTQRRGELIRYALANGYGKIALGHHMDDILETLLMNMMGKGELSTMTPLMRYDKWPLAIVRPLALAEERRIRECAAALGLEASVCACGYGMNTERKRTKSLLEGLTGGSSHRKRMMMASLSNVNPRYLPS